MYYQLKNFSQSGKLQTSVFHSGWHEQNPALWKSVSIVMEQTKRPIVLTAGKMFLINLETFLKVSSNKDLCYFCTIEYSLYLIC